MPHLIFRSCDPRILTKITECALPRLALAFDCPEDWITLERSANCTFGPTAFSAIEIHWFERSAPVKQAVVEILLSYFQEETLLPTVIFFPISPDNYFEDGRLLH